MFVSPSEAARIIGISASRVRQLIDTGKLQGERGPLGRVALTADVLRFARERCGRG